LKKRKEKKQGKKTKATELKEVRFSPFIGDHDLQTGLKKVKKFLSEGDLVKINIVFKGRQMAHTEFGPKLLDKILDLLEGTAVKEREPKFQGRRFATILKPSKKALQINNETKNKESRSKKIQNNPNGENSERPSNGRPSKSGKKPDSPKKV